MRASGSACWSRRPARPCWEAAWSPRSPFPPAAFAMAWLSSKTMTPSKSRPSQSTICWTRERLSSRAVGTQRGVGREEDALRRRIGVPWPETRQRRDEQPLLAERRPVALGVLDQLVGF